jgi:cell division cycle 20-like protein 1 (cofactor of APC complex)
LDAPSLQDDFYLNLVDWSPTNILAVGLGACVYLWSAVTSKVTKMCDLAPDDSICSVAWTQRGTYLAVGTDLGEVCCGICPSRFSPQYPLSAQHCSHITLGCGFEP